MRFMKTILKLLLAVGIIFSLTSCNEEKKLSIKGDIPITESTVLRINNEIVQHSDFPDASISLETLEGDAIALTLRNLVVGHPEIEILCNNTITKGSPIEASFSGTAIYADIMKISISGNFNENRIDLLEINTDYEYDIVGKWQPKDFILDFYNSNLPIDELDGIETIINTIIEEAGVFNRQFIELTRDGFVRNMRTTLNSEYSFQYYIDKMADLLYFYLRHSYTQAFKDYLENSDSAIKIILKEFGLYEMISQAADITLPTKFELSGKNKDRYLRIYMNEETVSPYISLFKESIEESIKKIKELDYSNLPSLIGKITPVQFELIKQEFITMLNLLIDPESTYQIGIKFNIIS